MFRSVMTHSRKLLSSNVHEWKTLIKLMQIKPNSTNYPSRRSKSASGFTLIESLILMGLITIGVAGVVYLMAISSNMSIETKDTMNAYQAANEYMEYVRQQPFTSTELNSQTDTVWGSTNTVPCTNHTCMGYNSLSKLLNSQGLYTVEAYQASTTMKRVTIKVNWSRKTQASRDRSIAIATIITDKGLNERWK
jgi:type II secretory pathway pseudopilin PulG